MNPRGTWNDKGAYDHQASDLVERFHNNFTQFESHVGAEVKAAAPPHRLTSTSGVRKTSGRTETDRR